MFTHEELIAEIPTLMKKPKPHLEVKHFTPDDFPSSSSEEFIQVCRAAKTEFESALHFWIASQQCQNWSEREEYFLPYLKEAACQSIKEDKFMLMLSQTRGLKRPIVITPKGAYIRGQQMANEWNDTSAIAEFEHEFIAFNWETTA